MSEWIAGILITVLLALIAFSVRLLMKEQDNIRQALYGHVKECREIPKSQIMTEIRYLGERLKEEMEQGRAVHNQMFQELKTQGEAIAVLLAEYRKQEVR
jgi:hypothetical protein